MKTRLYQWRAVPTNDGRWRIEKARRPPGDFATWVPIFGWVIWLINAAFEAEFPPVWSADHWWTPGTYATPEEGFNAARQNEAKFYERYDAERALDRKRQAERDSGAIY